jgi:excinuclease UvrABC ATPase subunit
VLENLRSQGFMRVVADGRTMHLDDAVAEKIDLTKAKELDVIVDRLTVDADNRGRVVEAFATAFKHGEGDATVRFAEMPPLSPLSPLSWCLRNLQRVRGRAQVRPASDRSGSIKKSQGRRDRSVDKASVRQQTAPAR